MTKREIYENALENLEEIFRQLHNARGTASGEEAREIRRKIGETHKKIDFLQAELDLHTGRDEW